jgi:hypothetical protein
MIEREMAGVSVPPSGKRLAGRALIVGGVSSRGQTLAAMQALGFECAELDDPYAAMAELLKRPLVYRAAVLSLASVYREELAIIATVRKRLPHVDVWLSHTESRQAAMVEGIRMGAIGLLGEDGVLHRMPGPATADESAGLPERPAAAVHETTEAESSGGEPVLSADELRALLQENPVTPPDQQS